MKEKLLQLVSKKDLRRRVYKEGEKLDLRGGTLRVQYEGGQADELINLTHSGVTVSGYDAQQKGGTKPNTAIPWFTSVR